MFLKRTGGGGQDYMIPAEAKERDLTEIMTIGPRDDLKAKKIEAKRMNFFGKMIEGLDRLYEEDRETFFEAQRLWDVLKKDLSNGTNESGLNPRGYRDTTPGETAASVIIKRFNMNQGGRVGFETGGMDEKGLRQLAIQLARQMNPEGRLSEEDVERAMIIIKNKIEGNTPPESMMIDTTTSAYGDAGKERPVPSFLTRDMKQTGGITETRNLPPEYVEALGKTYAADLTRQAGIPSITTATTQQPGETAQQFAQRQAQAQQFGITKAGMAELAPQVAAQDPYKQQHMHKQLIQQQDLVLINLF